MNHYFKTIADELTISSKQVSDTVSLLEEGGTVPFIARYRKEATGGLDEVQIAAIRDRIEQLRELDKRRESILKYFTDQNLLSPELKAKVEGALTMSELEDIYLPYKPKRRTKATIAKEKGLEPLAILLFKQEPLHVLAEAEKYIAIEKQVHTVDEALQGARDIMAEWISEQQEARVKLRYHFLNKGVLKSKVIAGKEEAAQKFKDYFEWEESMKNVPSHRLLAMRRGEKELFLALDIVPVEEEVIHDLEKLFIKGVNESAYQVKLAIADSYKRLLRPSIESDTRIVTKTKADEEAIKVFADNIKPLLMAAPLGQKRVMAIDPGFRTGCKVVCLDEQGKLLDNEVIYPLDSLRRAQESEEKIKHLAKQFQIEAIAIGNGTAGRETETWVRQLKLEGVQVVMVNESGASIYSASEVARDEFPTQDITVRGAVSIGRRLMDPLAELVKIDPKSIGVGQYQHDVDQTKLKNNLDDVVMSCVNGVGVEVNTASKQLLTYVSGLGPVLAQNIVDYRNENGPFKSKNELKKVARLGAKAYEQAAGFLRIRDAKHPLDASAVHPESYGIVEQMAKDLGCTVQDLIAKEELRKQIELKKYVTETVGIPTLTDIVQELAKPGRDPREVFEAIQFAEGINAIGDLHIGMKLSGIVTNVTNFGAFVDIGVHQDGLVHISQLSDTFVSDPSKLVKVQQKVEVTVTEIDVARKRIALSMKTGAVAPSSPKPTGANITAKPLESKSKPVHKQHEEPLNDLQAKLLALQGKFK
jgi:uncharacterized protein